MRTRNIVFLRLVARAFVAWAVALVLGAGLAGCSFSDTTRATNEGPFSDLMRDIQAAGITALEGFQTEDDGLYLRVLPVEGQDPGVTADKLLSLAQKYKEELDLRWARVVISPVYDHTFDLSSSPSST